MAVFCSVVQAPMLPMFNTRYDLSLGHTIAGQFVRDRHARYHALLLEQQALGRFGLRRL
jgi:hypothetical protein